MSLSGGKNSKSQPTLLICFLPLLGQQAAECHFRLDGREAAFCERCSWQRFHLDSRCDVDLFDYPVIACESNRPIFTWVAEGPSTWDQIWKGVTVVLTQLTFLNLAHQWTIRRGEAHLLFHLRRFPQKRGQQQSTSLQLVWNTRHVNNSKHKHCRFSKYTNRQFTQGLTVSARMPASLRSRGRW